MNYEKFRHGNKDGHHKSNDFEDGINRKEKAWIILACTLCLALASTCGKLGFPLLYLVTSPELLAYNRIARWKAIRPVTPPWFSPRAKKGVSSVSLGSARAAPLFVHSKRRFIYPRSIL